MQLEKIETVKPFYYHGNPKMVFGAGRIGDLLNLLPNGGPLFIVSSRHFSTSEAWKSVEAGLRKAGILYIHETVSGEPSPEVVDELTLMAQGIRAQALVSIGGGSVMDAGKAVSAMLREQGSVFHYLEGVGTRKLSGAAVPFIAAPTTAGTGSEAARNAVLSRRGANGFKKSLRHDALIPRIALIDPELALGTSPEVTLACGMDALCQLLEPLLSTEASPFTNALSWAGLAHFHRGSQLFDEHSLLRKQELSLRAELALAAYCSGIALTNAGLGTVHGLAGPLGAACDVPHGVACGLLLAPVLRRLQHNLNDSEPHKRVARILQAAGCALCPDAGASGAAALIEKIESWASRLPRLASWGLKPDALERVVHVSDNKNFPLLLSADERRACLEETL
ncbi:MAG: hypothetical protein B0D92_04745 [Spirochaeta sp. LUC14_002_19_P3]|nr:MAG: hypothetical protein B0D92_04745 [Spirochaeta sp. LUC14_002_19_P3]